VNVTTASLRRFRQDLPQAKAAALRLELERTAGLHLALQPNYDWNWQARKRYKHAIELKSYPMAHLLVWHTWIRWDGLMSCLNMIERWNRTTVPQFVWKGSIITWHASMSRQTMIATLN
jgi:hypothetical protein